MKKPVRKWWWKNQHRAWMVSLCNGNRWIPLGVGKTSVEVVGTHNIIPALQTLREAVS